MNHISWQLWVIVVIFGLLIIQSWLNSGPSRPVIRSRRPPMFFWIGLYAIRSFMRRKK